MKLFIFLLFSLSLLTGCIHIQSSRQLTQIESEPQRLIINNARVFSGNPEEPVSVRHLQIDQGIITQISDSPIIDAQAHTIDATGQFLMPGLIDFHAHITAAGAPPWRTTVAKAENNLSAFLAAGITSLVDPGGPLDEMEKWAEQQNQPDYQFPKLIYAGTLFTASHGHPNFMIEKSAPWPLSSLVKHMLISTPETKEEASKLIRAHKAQGASLIKVIIDEIPIDSPQLSNEMLKHIAQEASRQNLLTVAHIGTEKEMLKGLNAGINVFVHNPYRSTLSEEALLQAKNAQAMVIPTNVVFDNLASFYLRELSFSDYEKSLGDADIIEAYNNPPAEMEIEPSIDAWFKEVVLHRQDKIDHVKRMMDVGIPILAGSDSPNVATLPGSSLHKEFALWVEKGNITPQQALTAATYIPGQLLHKINQRNIGYIAEGFEADLLLIDGNPLKNIRDSQKIQQIILSGKLIKNTL